MFDYTDASLFVTLILYQLCSDLIQTFSWAMKWPMAHNIVTDDDDDDKVYGWPSDHLFRLAVLSLRSGSLCLIALSL